MQYMYLVWKSIKKQYRSFKFSKLQLRLNMTVVVMNVYDNNISVIVATVLRSVAAFHIVVSIIYDLDAFLSILIIMYYDNNNTTINVPI